MKLVPEIAVGGDGSGGLASVMIARMLMAQRNPLSVTRRLRNGTAAM